MGVFICKICDHKSGIGPEMERHECKKEDIINNNKRLLDDKYQAQLLADNIEDKVLLILSKYPKEILEGKEKIEIDAQLLRDLWYNLELIHYDERTPEEFCSNWLATHFVFCEASDLFIKKSSGKTILERLELLYKACVNANKIMGYGDEEELALPEKVAKELVGFVRPNWFYRLLGRKSK